MPLPRGSVAIVLGKDAAAPEQEGARLLREFVARRFRHDWPVVREGSEQTSHRTLIVLGQRSTNALLDAACREARIDLGEKAPGPDGYVIVPVDQRGRRLVLVGGSNARGAMYGQDTLGQLLQREGEELRLVPAVIRDAPVIPWRGRPQTMVAHYLRPGELDLYAQSRVNFIDLRSGIYAFEPGEKLDGPMIRKAVDQAHRRGFVVFATVNTGVPKADYPKVMGTFRELLDLGADGLWLSFDDKGPGEDPVGLTQDVLALGRERGINPRHIAITPPKGSYPKIVTDFNRRIMAVPGMSEALWFWTAVPAAERVAEAREIGLKVKPSWWHNWPRVFTAQQYVGLPPLSLGWSAPDYAALAAAGDYLEAAMPWGGNNMGQHYVVPTINWWAWNPAAHDWNAVRRRICGLVFGPEQADAAVRFDDQLHELLAQFRYVHKGTEQFPGSPPRPLDPAGAKRARQLVADMRVSLDRIAAAAPAATLVPDGQLEPGYLQPMRAALEVHARAADLRFPEEWWPETQRKIVAALHAGDTPAAERIIQPAAERVRAEVTRIAEALPQFPKVDVYVKWWKDRASLTPADWLKLLEAQRSELAARIADYGTRVETMTMIGALRAPPLEWGIGRWQTSNRLLATVLPKPQPQFWGDWVAGLHTHEGVEAAVFAAHRKVPGEPGEYVELPVTIPVSGRRDRLALLLFVSSTNKDLFSNTMIPFRWAGHRYITLRWGERLLWEQDLGTVPETGDWFMVRLPRIPEDVKSLELSLRAEDRRVSINNYTIGFTGPLRLMELPE